MARLTELQAIAMMNNGFRHGTTGYPILFSDNGKVTIVEEGNTRLVVWEFEPSGIVTSRSYNKEG